MWACEAQFADTRLFHRENFARPVVFPASRETSSVSQSVSPLFLTHGADSMSRQSVTLAISISACA